MRKILMPEKVERPKKKKKKKQTAPKPNRLLPGPLLNCIIRADQQTRSLWAPPLWGIIAILESHTARWGGVLMPRERRGDLQSGLEREELNFAVLGS